MTVTTFSFTTGATVSSWTVPNHTGLVTITAIGGGGGTSVGYAVGGNGARLAGTCTLTPGTVLTIIEGGGGGDSWNEPGGARRGGAGGGATGWKGGNGGDGTGTRTTFHPDGTVDTVEQLTGLPIPPPPEPDPLVDLQDQLAAQQALIDELLAALGGSDG